MTSHLSLKMEQIECSETSVYINQTPGNHPKENKQHSEHGESLKSSLNILNNIAHCDLKYFKTKNATLGSKFFN